MKQLTADIVIIGAGIAGLWMLNTLTKQGYDVLLLEADSIGGGQTTRSQGIIHGGIKYALNGVLSQASDAIKDMPQRWKLCIEGKGDVDLAGVTQLSDAHYLWSQRSLGAKITSFFAKKAMSGRVDSISKEDYPLIFKHPSFKGNLYKLNEVVLDTPSVMAKLSEKLQHRIIKLNTDHCRWERNTAGDITALIHDKLDVSITGQRFIFSAGEGNEAILEALKVNSLSMQRRPLHMVMVTHKTDLPIYAHCIGASSKPLVTITHHINTDGSYTWYFGGDISETGIELTKAQQINRAKELTAKVLPWVKLEEPHWDTLHINRAEPAQSALSRPDNAYLHCENNYITCWPTKLALAPDLSDKVINQLKAQNVTPLFTVNSQVLSSLNQPDIAKPAWSH